MMAALHEVVAFMDESGTPRVGIDLDPDDATELVAAMFGNKPFCLVSAWSILDVEGIPMPMLYAEHVIRDSKGRFRPGDWVRSSPAIASPGEGFFETRSTVYVLLGPGRIKQTRPEAVLALQSCPAH